MSKVSVGRVEVLFVAEDSGARITSRISGPLRKVILRAWREGELASDGEGIQFWDYDPMGPRVRIESPADVDWTRGITLWDEDRVQFARLIAELMAASDFLNSDDTMEALSTSMGLDIEHIEHLVKRAEQFWDYMKAMATL